MTVLDLCAAPGNKTAQAIEAGARVIACDRYLKRLDEVPAAAERVVLDATQPLPFVKKFDRILIDAPCSGTGTLGRNPEIKWRLKPGDANIFSARQRAMLDQARRFMKPAAGSSTPPVRSKTRKIRTWSNPYGFAGRNPPSPARPRPRRWLFRRRDNIGLSA